MKKITIVTIAVMLFATVLTSQVQALDAPFGLRAGAHGAITAGGDVDGGELGFGGQVEMSLSDHFGIELALTHFSDEVEQDIDVNVTSLALSAVGRVLFPANINGYFLGGVNYNFVSISSPYPISADNDLGFHLGAGVGKRITDNLEVFGEYRYTFLDVDVKVLGFDVGSGDLDYGLFKFGVNYLF